MNNFSLATAWKIAWRETRASAARFLFVVLAVALGVGALTGVRGFSNSFRNMLLKEARTLMAADLTVRIFGHPAPAQQAVIDSLARRGVDWTLIIETLSMVTARSSPDPVLVSIKAVDPSRYPFYGAPTLEPAGTVRERLQPGTALASPDLLERLGARAGDTVRVGGIDLRIAAAVTAEPDRMSGSFNVGPRIFITRADLERAGLLGLGSRAAERFLFRVGSGSPTVQGVREELNRAFPEARITDYRETNPQITQGLERATTFLSLITLIALIVGALGVGTAMHAHVQQKLDSIAVMKSLGARSSQVMRIYLLQTLALGFGGALLGVAAGLAVQRVFPLLIARYFQNQPEVSLDLMTAAQGLAAGVITTLLFTLPPLAGIRRVKPNLILRRDMPDSRRTWRGHLRDARVNLIALALILSGLFGLSLWLVGGSLRDGARIGAWFVGGLGVSLLLLAGVAWLLLRSVRAVTARVRLSPTVRHGLANVYRPGSQAPAILTALGIGVMFTLTVYLIQRSVLDRMVQEAPAGMPNVFLLDITPQQREAVLGMLNQYSAGKREPELLTTVACRLVKINGVPVDPRFTRSRAVSVSSDLPAQNGPTVSVSERAARQFGIKAGGTVEWDAYGRRFTTRVAQIHQPDTNRISGMAEFRISPGPLSGLPTVLYGAARLPENRIASLQRESYQRFPAVTVINMADILARIEEVVDQITLVIRFISAFAIIAGATILASSIAGTRFRRIREVVILKTLGATRARIVRIFSTEFLLLGLVAGLMGSLLASAFSNLLLTRLLNAPARLDFWPIATAVLATALIATATGWLASWRILGEKPLEVLRNE